MFHKGFKPLDENVKCNIIRMFIPEHLPAGTAVVPKGGLVVGAAVVAAKEIDLF